MMELHNALRIMRSIDRSELEAVGIHLGDSEWLRFAQDPYDWLIRADDIDAALFWRIMTRRMTR
jgi:hypothetical protein